jgi:hypothetical protein
MEDDDRQDRDAAKSVDVRPVVASGVTDRLECCA